MDLWILIYYVLFLLGSVSLYAIPVAVGIAGFRDGKLKSDDVSVPTHVFQSFSISFGTAFLAMATAFIFFGVPAVQQCIAVACPVVFAIFTWSGAILAQHHSAIALPFGFIGFVQGLHVFVWFWAPQSVYNLSIFLTLITYTITCVLPPILLWEIADEENGVWSVRLRQIYVAVLAIFSVAFGVWSVVCNTLLSGDSVCAVPVPPVFVAVMYFLSVVGLMSAANITVVHLKRT